jgi:hypothetical protein
MIGSQTVREGLPMPREPAEAASGAMDGGAQTPPTERRPGVNVRRWGVGSPDPPRVTSTLRQTGAVGSARGWAGTRRGGGSRPASSRHAARSSSLA